VRSSVSVGMTSFGVVFTEFFTLIICGIDARF